MAEQKLKLKTFGIAREIMGGGEVRVEAARNVKELKDHLFSTFPKLRDLNSLLIAVNQTYASDETPLSENDEIAIIPPVSGG